MIIKKTTEGSEATLFLDGWLDTQAAPELQAELEKTWRECPKPCYRYERS